MAVEPRRPARAAASGTAPLTWSVSDRGASLGFAPGRSRSIPARWPALAESPTAAARAGRRGSATLLDHGLTTGLG